VGLCAGGEGTCVERGHAPCRNLGLFPAALRVGLTLYGLVIVLWPLSFLNHSVLRWLDRRSV
jgi:hypothetical protein